MSKSMRMDAQRSKAAIVAAAASLLNEHPDVSIEAIARAAGVTRQTVYAHYPARTDLVAAVIEQVTGEVVAAMDAVDVDDVPAAEAVLGLLEAGAKVSGRYPGLQHLAETTPVSIAADLARHGSVVARLKRVVVRGQRSGEFDVSPSADWLVAAIVGLGHVRVPRMSRKRAAAALRMGVLRLLGVADGR